MILLAFNALTLVLGVALFLVVTLILVALLIYVKDKLTPSGEVDIDINEGEKILKTEMGNSLLSTLSNNQVFLPSACGGGGTCGMCKCRVLEGGGSILPTETGFFSRRQQQEQWRLACQVKVKDNLKIQIPEEILGIKKWECEVVSNHNVASFIKEFVVKLPEGEQLKFKPAAIFKSTFPKLRLTSKIWMWTTGSSPNGTNSSFGACICPTPNPPIGPIPWPITRPKAISSC